MNYFIIWFIVVSLGFVITYAVAGWMEACGTLIAAAAIILSFLITRLFKVAGRHTVSKMGTAWMTQELRRMAWRVMISLFLAGLAFKLAWPQWGIAFWLNFAIYYQVGLILHLRDIRTKASQAPNFIRDA
jgi:hypothetical protein